MNFFYQVKESVIDFKFYKRIKDNRFAKTFLYMLLLFLIVYSVITVRNFVLVKNVMERVAFELDENMPNFQLKDNKFSFEGEMPFYIASSTSEVFVIDTTGAVDESVLKDAATGVLITADRAYIKNNMQQQTMEFRELQDVELNKQDIIQTLPSLSWLVLIFMLLWFVFALGGHLLYAILLALVGLIISSSLKTDLKFNHLLNFSIYALTLPMLIDLAVDISGFPISPFLFFMIYSTIAVVYLIFAIKAYNEGENGLSDNDQSLI